MSDASSSRLADSTVPFADQPLGLTVHSMPGQGGATGETDVRRTRAGRLRMLLVLLVCAAPVIASYLTYYVIRPEGRSVFGQLIDPQVPMPATVAQRLDGSKVDLRSLKDQWLLVSVAGGACDAACERHLYLQRQVRESLGREKDRVDWAWLIDDAAPVNPALQPALANAMVLRVAPDVLRGWLAPAQGHGLSEHLYLVDPQGHWMMRFPAGLDAASATRARRDIDRLLRASASWDQEGR